MTGFVPFDVEPESASEVLVTIISLFFGFITQCVIISSATSALQAVDSKDMAAKQRLDSITQWLAFKRVPAELRMRILEFFEYSLARAGEDSELMRGLPAHLAMMLSISMNKQLILQCPVFHSLKNTEIMKLLAKLEPRIFVPGQVIIREGEKNRSLFFINRGVVRVVRGLDDPDDEPEVIDMLGDNDYFGDVRPEQLLDAPADAEAAHICPASVQCVSFVDIMLLSEPDHDELARLQPKMQRRESRRESRRFQLARASSRLDAGTHKNLLANLVKEGAAGGNGERDSGRRSSASRRSCCSQ